MRHDTGVMDVTQPDRSENSIPGPSGRLLIGSLAAFSRDILGTLEQGWRDYGDLVRYKLGPTHLYAVSSPQLADQILVRDKQHFLKLHREDGKPVGLALVLGKGLLTNADQESWLLQRRMMQPIFHRRNIARMGDEMLLAGQHMLERWQRDVAPGGQINLHHEMMVTTLDIINKTMFGADVLGEASEIGTRVEIAARFVSDRTKNPFQPPLSIPTPRNRGFKQASREIDNFIYQLIDQRAHSAEQREDLLQMLLEARDEETGEAMTRQQIRDEVVTIFGAGHETTANALTWAWALLAQHPEVLHRLQTEIDSVLGKRPPSMEDLPKLPYCNAVFDEVLRLRPPAPITLRQTTVPVSLGGYSFAAGTRFIISIININRHPDHWPEPEHFMPERFLEGQRRDQHKLAYLPFGAGQRMCIGNHFALMEGVLLLILMVQHYELHTIPGEKIEADMAVTMRPKGGLNVTLHPR